MTDGIVLRGITWNHTRRFCPKVATAQRYQELHPEVEIRWEKRSLQAFADQSIKDLASHYDLLVIDTLGYSWGVGAAARCGSCWQEPTSR